MASTENAVNPQTGKEKWLAYIDEEIDEIGASSPVETELLVLLRKLLLSDCSTAQIAYAAQKIDACYVNTYLGLDPLQKFSEDKGMGNYIATVYLTIFNLACVVSYEDFRHDVLVQLICELRNIPPKPFKIWGEDCLVYSDEPVFGNIMRGHWNTVSDEDEQKAENGCSESKQKCEEWVNLSSFLARCLAVGLDHKSSFLNCSFVDIENGLKEDVGGTTGSCRVMVAAQFILLTTESLYKELSKSKDLGKWQHWAKRFKEIADKGDLSPEVHAAVDEARGKMISFDPALFFVSEGGNKADP